MGLVVGIATAILAYRIHPIFYGKAEADMLLSDARQGAYLLYRDHETENLYLSVRREAGVRHHRILQLDNLFYLDNQPYPYLDSIVLYHRKHKLKGIKLTQQVYLSPRTEKAFKAKIAARNGNAHAENDINFVHPTSFPLTTDKS